MLCVTEFAVVDQRFLADAVRETRYLLCVTEFASNTI